MASNQARTASAPSAAARSTPDAPSTARARRWGRSSPWLRPAVGDGRPPLSSRGHRPGLTEQGVEVWASKQLAADDDGVDHSGVVDRLTGRWSAGRGRRACRARSCRGPSAHRHSGRVSRCCMDSFAEPCNSVQRQLELREAGRIVAKLPPANKLTASWNNLTASGNQLTASGKLLTASERLLTTSGRPLTASERLLTASERLLTASGRPLTASGRPLTASGRLSTASVNQLTASEPRPTTENGRSVIPSALSSGPRSPIRPCQGLMQPRQY